MDQKGRSPKLVTSLLDGQKTILISSVSIDQESIVNFFRVNQIAIHISYRFISIHNCLLDQKSTKNRSKKGSGIILNISDLLK